MTAPAGPRPGWSRRAQYSLFFGFLAAVVGLLVGVFMLILSLAAPQTYASVRGAALDVASPITGPLAEVGATAKGLVSGAGNYWDAASQNKKLKKEREQLRRTAVRAAAVFQENKQLKAALGLREQSRVAVAAGRIVGSSFESPRRFAIISVGRGDGVEVGMPVRTADGLVGRVIATGRGDGTIDIRPLEVGRNPFKRGDVIVSSGTGGLYPPLVPIARVVRLDDDGALGMPVADPSQASFAIVEKPFEPAALAAATAAEDR